MRRGRSADEAKRWREYQHRSRICLVDVNLKEEYELLGAKECQLKCFDEFRNDSNHTQVHCAWIVPEFEVLQMSTSIRYNARVL